VRESCEYKVRASRCNSHTLLHWSQAAWRCGELCLVFVQYLSSTALCAVLSSLYLIAHVLTFCGPYAMPLVQ